MEFIKDELDHKRKVELAQANMRALIITSPLLNEHIKVSLLGSIMQLILSIIIKNIIPIAN